MTLDELTAYFKHQLTASENWTPPEKLEYQTIDAFNGTKATLHVLEKNLPDLLETFNKGGYLFEGYRDRTPYFVKPEIHVFL
jgi:hypothetical protein